MAAASPLFSCLHSILCSSSTSSPSSVPALPLRPLILQPPPSPTRLTKVSGPSKPGSKTSLQVATRTDVLQEFEESSNEDGAAKKMAAGSDLVDETQNINITIKGILGLLIQSVRKDGRSMISLGLGDPTVHRCFRTTNVAQQAVADALQSQTFNGYAPAVGLPQTRRAISEYLSRDLPYELSPDDVFVTCGCTQAVDVAMAMLARPGANILLPRPGFTIYEQSAAFRGIEVRHFDLLPERGWEADPAAISALADRNTVALVVINPGNPCGNVYSYHHLMKIAETAEMLRIPVIADEVYGHLAFGHTPFVPMGVFGSMVPVLTLGSISKRWLVPGWRLGWFVTTDPSAKFKKPQVVERITKYFDILGGPATFIQAAVPDIIQHTDEAFFKRTIDILKQASIICYDSVQEIPCISCLHRPEGSMAVMMKLNLSLLEDVSDDIDFCFKLAKEESVIILPGTAVGLSNWIRITFAVDPVSLQEALGRLKSFCQRHAKRLYL